MTGRVVAQRIVLESWKQVLRGEFLSYAIVKESV